MARNDEFIAARPARIFEVLSDPDCYGEWVVGSKYIRDADPGWPGIGTKFHHAVGFGPFTVKDHTKVLESHPPHLIKLKAKSRPLGQAHVTLAIEAEGNGSRVTMIEDAGDPLTALVFNPLTHLLVRGRNEGSLRRLKRISERNGG